MLCPISHLSNESFFVINLGDELSSDSSNEVFQSEIESVGKETMKIDGPVLAGLLLSLCFLCLLNMNGECMETAKQPLALRARLGVSELVLGSELKPTVSLVNVSGKALKLEYLKPSIVVPEIWDVSSKQRILNAPTYVYDQVSARQETLLAPDEELELFSLPIFLSKQSPPTSRPDHLQGFWATLPGTFRLKYSVTLKNFLPSASGEVHADELEITVIDQAKELTGTLFFENGKGYYLSLGTKGGKGSVWLMLSENKILVGQLQDLLGSEIKVRGRLQRMPENARGAIPSGALYFSNFEIK